VEIGDIYSALLVFWTYFAASNLLLLRTSTSMFPHLQRAKYYWDCSARSTLQIGE